MGARKGYYKNMQFKVFHHMCMALGPICKNEHGEVEWLFECFHNGPGCEGEFIAVPSKVKYGFGKKSCGCHLRDDISGKIFYDSDGNPTCQALWFLYMKDGKAWWLFRCLINGPGCKYTFPALAKSVKEGATSSCGCSRVDDLTGKWFGRWYVIDKLPYEPGKPTKWNCICKCCIKDNKYNPRNVRAIVGSTLKNGSSKGCNKCSGIKHGDSRTKFYGIWAAMIQRCNNPNSDNYKHYGGRGIKVCDRWLDYENFKEDMYDLYIDHKSKHTSTSLNRINNDGEYCLINCCWSTQQEQCQNMRPFKHQRKFEGKRLSDGYTEESNNQQEFCRKHNLTYQCVNDVLKDRSKTHKGWTFKYIQEDH